MSDDIFAPLDHFNARVQVYINLRIELPGMANPIFLGGMKLNVDRYFYERYREMGELDKYLHYEAVRYLMENSRADRVVIGGYADKPFPLGDS